MEYNAQQICAKSRNKKTSVKIQLLNSDNNVVDELQGDVNAGTIVIKNSLDSNFSRRSGSLDLNLTKTLSTNYYKIDLAHRVRIIITVTDNISGVSANYIMGIFLLSNPHLSQTVGSEKITVTLVDIMSLFDGTFGKSVDANQTAKVTSGINIGTAILATATGSTMMNLPSDKVKIEPTDALVIENISTSPESNITDHLKGIMDDALNYELYFDIDGILTFEYIKDRSTDSVFQEFINSDVVVGYEIDEDFSNVRNVVNVVGKTTSDGIQQTGQYKEENLNNPLSIHGKYGERPITISNDKLYTKEQCNNQAKYECIKRTNYKEKIIMQILPDYRLQPNKKIKIQYTSYTENLSIDGYYLIDEISVDLKATGLMSITCHKLYPVT